MCMYFKSNQLLNFEGLGGKVLENGCEDTIKVKFIKPLIFDNPKYVTACRDIILSKGIEIVAEKDYKVKSVNTKGFVIINELGDVKSVNTKGFVIINELGDSVFYHEDFFHKVTYEDLLPEKDTSESKEEGFENLVISPDALEKGGYIVKSKFSEEQLLFVQKVMDIPCNLIFDDKIHAFFLHGYIRLVDYYKFKELSFNDIFKHKSEI